MDRGLIPLPSAISRPLRKNTGYRTSEVPEVNIPKVFDTDRDSRMFRFRVFHPQILPGSNITEKRCGRGEFGLEVVKPNAITVGADVFTSKNETYGINTINASMGQYYYLPGLEPDDKLVALGTDPQLPYSIVRDRYTGLHMISFGGNENSDRGKNVSVKIHYILETKPWVSPWAIPEKPRHRYTSPQPVTHEDAFCPKAASRVIRNLLQPASLNKLTQPVREGLQAIDQAVDDNQRITAITHFCRGFQGDKNPADDENFLAFLLTQRQGTCHHRSIAFVLLCRYYGISARLVLSQVHAFPEYSLDGRRSWQTAELDGAPMNVTVTSGDFPSQQEGRHLTKRMATLLQNMDEQRLALLAKAAGLKAEELRNIGVSGAMAASAQVTDLHFIVSNLLEQKEPESFVLAVDLLETIGDQYDKAKELLGKYTYGYQMEKLPCAAVHSMVLSGKESSGEKRWIPVMKLMERLHEKARSMDMEPEWSMLVLVWLEELIKAQFFNAIDEECYLAVLETVLEKNWLLNFAPYLSAEQILNFLHSKNKYERLNPLFTRSILTWYQKVLVPDLSSLDKVQSISKKQLSVEMKSSHSGRCPRLEAEIRTTDVGQRWSDEPENIPDIERLLSGQQAFPTTDSGNNELRPVIWQVTSNCLPDAFQGVVTALLQRYCQESGDDRAAIEANLRKKAYNKRFYHSAIKEVCYHAVLTAFSHCLYKTICKEGSSLTLAWNKAANSQAYASTYYLSGSCQVESDTQLSRLVNGLASDLASPEDKPLIRKAFNMSNALVVMPEDITRYAHEFAKTLDVDSLYQEFKGQVISNME